MEVHCRHCVFLSIHGICETRVYTARGERQPSEVFTPTDRRVNHETRPRKISDESQQCVRDHISSFPRYTIIIAVLPLLLSTLVDELSIETN